MHYEVLKFVSMSTDDMYCLVLDCTIGIKFYRLYKSCSKSVGNDRKLFLQRDTKCATLE